MTAARTSKCRSCGAAIRWARTVNGKAIPLDVEQSIAGNVRLDGAGIAHVLGPLDLVADPDELRWMPHHATCPNWGKR